MLRYTSLKMAVLFLKTALVNFPMATTAVIVFIWLLKVNNLDIVVLNKILLSQETIKKDINPLPFANIMRANIWNILIFFRFGSASHGGKFVSNRYIDFYWFQIWSDFFDFFVKFRTWFAYKFGIISKMKHIAFSQVTLSWCKWYRTNCKFLFNIENQIL